MLEPLEELEKRGFEVELLEPNEKGWVSAEQVRERLREDTLLVSVMHANNETGVLQPIDEIAGVLKDHVAYLHVDAAQTYGKEIETLRNPRIDLVSASAHKIFGPKGVGALITRRRGFNRVPLKPIAFGGGQERGLRPGTLPVHLIVAFGLACELALKNHAQRVEAVKKFREGFLKAIEPIGPVFNGDQSKTMPNVVNVSFEGLNSEAAIVGLKELVAISNGSACTSASYSPSHVLKAMNLPEDRIFSALRVSWCHMTPEVDWKPVVTCLWGLRL